MKVLKIEMKNKPIIWGGALLIIILVSVFLSLEIKFPHSIDIAGQILPVRELILIRDNNGNLSYTLFNHLHDFVEICNVINFERGDFGQFKLADKFYQHSYVLKGDTLGRFFSNELTRMLAQLRGQLEVEKAMLEFYNTGEKFSVIEEIQQQLSQAQALAEEKKRIYERQKALYEEGLVSQEEADIASSVAEQTRLAAKSIEAQLQSVSTGAKSAQLDLSRKRIQALQREIQALDLREQTYILLSPLSGRLIHSNAADTVLIAVDTTSFITKMMVKLHDMPFVSPSSKVEVKNSRTGQTYQATLSQIDGGIRFVNTEPVVLVNAIIHCDPCSFMPGIPVECSIHCEPLTLFDHLKRVAGSVTIK
jgi:hypothetical protein